MHTIPIFGYHRSTDMEWQSHVPSSNLFPISINGSLTILNKSS